MDPIDQLIAVEEIKKLKARYFRCMDTKDWDGYAAVFAPDAMLDVTGERGAVSDDEPAENWIVHGNKEIAGFVKAQVGDVLTVHHGHMPEIEILSDRTAQGVWAMFDHVDDMAKGFAIKGAGHYHEQYARGDDGKWRIHELRLTRIRVDAVEPTSPAIAREWPPAWKRS